MHVHFSQNHYGDGFYHGNVSSDRHVCVGEDVRGGEGAKLRGGVELPSGHFVISMRLFFQNNFFRYFFFSIIFWIFSPVIL